MSVEYFDFHDQYETLKDDAESEINRRTAINRGYYYSFHRVREECRDDPASDFSNGSGDHTEVIRFFKRRNLYDLADLFENLQAERKKADYELHKTISQEKLEKFRLDIIEFEEELSNCPTIDA